MKWRLPWPEVLLEFSSFVFLDNFALKYFEQPFNNSARLQHDILYIKVEAVNNVDFIISSNQLVKLTDVYYINLEIPAEKPFLHKAADKHKFQVNYSFKKSVLGTYQQKNLKYGETNGIQRTNNAFFAICFSSIESVSIWKS